MAIAYFITHPEVTINPSVPVPDWSLSSEGVRRVVRLLDQAWVRSVRTVFTSAERKALEAAQILADHLSLEPVVIAELGENDRSATGFLPKAEFELVADEFFAHPDESVRGWERAIDAQRRIVRAVNSAIATAPRDGDIAIVSHGAVGALLRCHLEGMSISRTEDQPAGGGGNLYSFDVESRHLLSGWLRIDE
ncbi:MAG TPA: histidine phosphatase family protein [Acetobacteraceae bacterium]|jgi:broad specificity phosphatase PhoE|nr:histidine phosphatase family protein [Acetobacteraceae bacterium]